MYENIELSWYTKKFLINCRRFSLLIINKYIDDESNEKSFPTLLTKKKDEKEKEKT